MVNVENYLPLKGSLLSFISILFHQVSERQFINIDERIATPLYTQ